MMKKIRPSFRTLSKAVMLGAIFTAFSATQGLANDGRFIKSVAGEWKGPGKIIAGKYKDTKFRCKLKGIPHVDSKPGFELDGSCRVGVFNQPMSAKVIKKGRSYKGQFLDGAEGKGLDITSGKINSKRAVVAIKRNALDGAMVADMLDPNTLNVTVSVNVGNSMVPVISMTLSRTNKHKASFE